jgi:hypothetical protein
VTKLNELEKMCGDMIKTTNGLKRNHVVEDVNNSTSGFWPARIWRILDSEHVITICTGLHVKKMHVSELRKLDYTGRWMSNRSIREKTHFLGMTRLRGLIKGARRYNPELIPEE